MSKVKFFKKYRKFLFWNRHIFTTTLNLKEPITVNEGKCGKYIAKEDFKNYDLANYTKKALNDYVRLINI